MVSSQSFVLSCRMYDVNAPRYGRRCTVRNGRGFVGSAYGFRRECALRSSSEPFRSSTTSLRALLGSSTWDEGFWVIAKYSSVGFVWRGSRGGGGVCRGEELVLGLFEVVVESEGIPARCRASDVYPRDCWNR